MTGKDSLLRLGVNLQDRFGRRERDSPAQLISSGGSWLFDLVRDWFERPSQRLHVKHDAYTKNDAHTVDGHTMVSESSTDPGACSMRTSSFVRGQKPESGSGRMPTLLAGP